MFLGKSDLKICSKFTGEHPYRSVILIKFQSIFIEIALRHGCSPVNLLHIFITPFSKNTSWGLLLVLQMRVAKEAKLLKLLTFLKELVQECQEIPILFKEPECIYTFPVKWNRYLQIYTPYFTAQKMKFSITSFCSKFEPVTCLGSQGPVSSSLAK